MRLVDRVTARLRATPVPLVEPWQESQPYSREQWASADYGDYLATSNDVYSCAWLRAKTMGVVPWQVFNLASEDDPKHPLRLLLDRPNPWMTGIKFRVNIELCLAIWGEAVVLLERGSPNPRTPPRELWPVKPTFVKAVPHRTDFISGYVYQPPGGGGAIPLRPDEVWHIQYPNPNDLYSPLAPMAAVRLAAEVASEAMKANRALFRQGMMVGGFAMPPDASSSFTTEQATELERLIKDRFTGQSNAHRWQVLRYFMQLKDMAVTPKDAEWIQGSNLTFRQVCRGMGVPPALVGDAEYATLANLTVYDRALWEHTMEFESAYLGAEATLQLVPAYSGVSRVALDLSNVVALQEDEQIKWGREKDQLAAGAITINEWRVKQGLEPVPWGDAWWAPMSVSPVHDDSAPSPSAPPSEAPVTESVQSRALRRRQPRHPRPDFADVTDGLRDDLTVLFARQKDAILRALKQQPAVRSVAEVADEPFEMARWTERTRAACQARFVAATERALLREGQLVGLTPAQVSDLIESRAVRAAIEGNVQRFAQHISTTTYNQVKSELEMAVRLGETVDQMASRIVNVMGGRVEDARRIAVSEVTRSTTTGQMAAYTAAEVPYKIWFTQGDSDVRDTHVPLDGMAIPVGDLFTVGGARGYGPGTTGDPAQDCGCRCWLEPSNEVE